MGRSRRKTLCECINQSSITAVADFDREKGGGVVMDVSVDKVVSASTKPPSHSSLSLTSIVSQAHMVMDVPINRAVSASNQLGLAAARR